MVGRHDGDGGLCQFQQVGGHIKGLVRAHVHTADAARGENADVGQAGRDHGGGDGGGAGAPLGHAHGHVGAADLVHIPSLRQCFQLLVGQTHVQPPRDHRHRGGRGTGGAHVFLDLARDLKVLRIGHAVGDDRAFQRDNGRSAGLCVGDFGGAGVGMGQLGVSPET